MGSNSWPIVTSKRSFCIDDVNGDDDAINYGFDWSNDEK